MEKLMTKNALKTFTFVRLALMAGVGFPLILGSNAFAQLPAPGRTCGAGCSCPERQTALFGRSKKVKKSEKKLVRPLEI
jgi:hypothetical protein